MCSNKCEHERQKSSSSIQKNWQMCNRHAFTSDPHAGHHLKNSTNSQNYNGSSKEIHAKCIYQQSLINYSDNQRGEIMDKHQARLATQIMKDSSDFILYTWSDQLTAIKKSDFGNFNVAQIKH
jgi:hypothetical protein